MGDLQCAARVFVARHAGTERDSLRLAETLAGERICRVWSSTGPEAARTVEVVARQLGVGVVVHEDLREPAPDETDESVRTRVVGVLDEIADAHRGEGVLVLGHVDAMRTALPTLARNLGGDFLHAHPLAHGGVVELAADDDGWVARRRAGGEDVPRSGMESLG